MCVFKAGTIVHTPYLTIMRTTSLYQYIYFPVRGRNLAKPSKQLPWISFFFRTEIIVNDLFSVDGDTKKHLKSWVIMNMYLEVPSSNTITNNSNTGYQL